MRNGPAIAGVAQIANHDDDVVVHPLDLIERAVRAALDDAGIDLDRVGGVLAAPMSTWESAPTSELLAARLGLRSGLRGDSLYSGAGAQRLLADAARTIDGGEVDVVVIAGGIADGSVRRARRLGIDPPALPTATWSQGSSGGEVAATMAIDPADLPPYLAEVAAGAGLPAAYFALVESAMHPGVDVATQGRRLGALLAPFTTVAATRPDLAWFPVERTPEEIATASASNRMVAEPYTKLMCSFPTVDLAAAIVVTSASSAGGRSVRPLSIAAAKEPGPPSVRQSIGASVALDRAVEQALELARLDAGAIDRFDLYSCFPAAVQLAVRAFGIGAEDPRPRTVTGGLPYFGGPGASYTIHAIVSMVEELRADAGSIGAVVGVGGMVDDFSVGIYSTGDAPFRSADLGVVAPGAELRPDGSGRAVVDAMTVLHDRDLGPTNAPIIARFEDGSRLGARAADADLPATLAGTSLVGREVIIDTVDGRSRYTPV